MRRLFLFTLLILLIPLQANAQTYTLDEDYGKVPVTFVPNVGQFDSTLAFIVEGNNGDKIDDNRLAYFQFGSIDGNSSEVYTYKIRLVFETGDIIPEAVFSDQKPWNTNYFLGDDPDRWQTDVPNYQTVVYNDIYDGIDLRISSEARNVIFNVVIHAGADPSQISLLNVPTDYEVVGITEDGELIGDHVLFGDVPDRIVSPPACFQVIGGQQVPVNLEFRLIGGDPANIGFTFGEYDPMYELIIQPELVDSDQWTYRNVDEVFDIISDDNNSIYAAAKAVFYPYRIVPDYEALFAIKMDEEGDGMEYITYFGVREQYVGYVTNIEIDSAGDLYIGGSFNAPVTPGTFSSEGDGISVLKLHPDGNSIVYSVEFGGSSSLEYPGIHLVQDGTIWLYGSTRSVDFPTTENAFRRELLGTRDIYITHLNEDGSNLLYSTYYGGSGQGMEGASAIVTDSSGNVLVCGGTMSQDFPLVGNVLKSQRGADGSDIVFFKLDDQYNVVLSTYFGGNKEDTINNIVSDSSGNIWMTGSTESDDFFTTDNSKNLTGELKTVLMRFSVEDIIDFSTLLSKADKIKIYVDENDTVLVQGGTSNPNFPFQPGDAQEGRYIFVVAVDPADGMFTQTSLISYNASYAYYIKTLNNDKDVFFVDTVNGDSASPLFDDYGTIRKASPDYAVYVEDAAEHPMAYIIYPPYPNPFNATVTIQYQVLKQDHLKLAIYNALGQHVDTLIDRNMAPGLYSVHWDASEYSSGVYYYHVWSGAENFTGKMMLLK